MNVPPEIINLNAPTRHVKVKMVTSVLLATIRDVTANQTINVPSIYYARIVETEKGMTNHKSVKG